MSESIETRALRWASSSTTGASSKAILKVMTGNHPKDGYCYPHDPQDFERCRALLELIPEWKARLSEMKAVGAEWAALVDHWAELESLHAKGSYPATYRRMKKILDPIEAKRPGLIKIGGGAIYFPSDQ